MTEPQLSFPPVLSTVNGQEEQRGLLEAKQTGD